MCELKPKDIEAIILYKNTLTAYNITTFAYVSNWKHDAR